MSVYRKPAQPTEPRVAAAEDHVEVSSSTIACPRCDAELSMATKNKVALHACVACGGAWLSLDQARNFSKKSYREMGLELARGLSAALQKHPSESAPIECPFCERLAVRSRLDDGVWIDSCEEHGVWFDFGELASSGLLPSQLTHKPRAQTSAMNLTKLGGEAAVTHQRGMEAHADQFRAEDDSLIAFIVALIDELLGTRR